MDKVAGKLPGEGFVIKCNECGSYSEILGFLVHMPHVEPPYDYCVKLEANGGVEVFPAQGNMHIICKKCKQELSTED